MEVCVEAFWLSIGGAQLWVLRVTESVVGSKVRWAASVCCCLYHIKSELQGEDVSAEFNRK